MSGWILTEQDRPRILDNKQILIIRNCVDSTSQTNIKTNIEISDSKEDIRHFVMLIVRKKRHLENVKLSLLITVSRNRDVFVTLMDLTDSKGFSHWQRARPGQAAPSWLGHAASR